MLCHLMVYVRLVLTTLTIVTCLFGDNYVEVTHHPLLKALADNATHSVIGALSGISFVVHIYDKISNITGWLVIFGCFAVSSCIDFDHFIEARSLNLEMATALSHRPFLHCSTITLSIIFMYVVLSCLDYFKSSLVFAVLCIAFITHHTRDAIRHGYWFCPFGHTRKVPYHVYLTLTILTPYLIFYIFTLSRSNFIQYYALGKTIGKHYDGTRSTKYSIV